MFKFSKYFSINALKRTTYIILPTALMFGLSACSTDVARFAYQDSQYKQQTQNTVKQTNLAPLANNSAPANNPSPASNSTDSEFTASIPSNRNAQNASSNWMYKRNPNSYTVSTGDTLYSISRRYGITVEELRSANGFGQYTNLRIGQNILLPRHNNSSAVSYAPRTYVNQQTAEIQTAPSQSNNVQRQFVPNRAPITPIDAYKPVQSSATYVAPNGKYIVQPKDTLYSIARKHKMSFATLKSLNGFVGTESLQIGQHVRVSGNAVQPATATRVTAPAKQVVNQRVAVAQKKVVASQPKNSGVNRFRWPVNGRVISEYGPKAGGTRNDGLNVAVPPGTVVKAAESGEVVYSGNGLPNYGNLVLIKHNKGWVTAYAHNGSILVKKGDKVRRARRSRARVNRVT